jgi:hypothetical protein
MKNQSLVAIEFATSIENRLRALRSADKVSDGGSRSGAAPLRSADPDLQEAREKVKRAFCDALELASISGRFDPRDLFAKGVDEETRQLVLSRLAPACEIEHFGGGVRWFLLKDARAEALATLIRQERLRYRLEQPLPPTDRFGKMLRELLRDGARVELAGRTEEELLALTSVLEATSDVPLEHPDESELRRLIKKSKFLDEYDVLLANGFFGRKDDLNQLHHFLISGHISGATSAPFSSLILTGLGGAGKSTLLARFARDLFAERSATVVILDFDRPGVDANDLYWLEAEMSRQVGAQYPNAAEMLRQLRLDVRQQKTESESDSPSFGSEQVTYERGHRQIVSGIRDALIEAQAAESALLLILDTFEEVTQRNIEGKLIEWLYEIDSHLSPIALRVIFSGRLYGEDCSTLNNFGVKDSIEINELEPLVAERFLVQLGLSPGAANRLANSDVLPRRPLELKLLAKLIGGGDERAAIELEAEIRDGGAAARALFAGIVYRRVLQRIRNQTARSLAYPGLVLRYVTADLIKEVLIPALALPPLNDREVERALDALASYGWLAYRGSHGEVYHRKDIRRSMLKAMIAKESKLARKINEGAARFFSTANTDNERAEGIYHRLMLMRDPSEGDAFELAELKKACQHIGADAIDLPPSARALLKFAVDDDLPISEIELLPPRYREPAYDQTGQRLVVSREFGKALALCRLARGKWDGARFRPHSSLSQWEVNTLFATASWDDLKDLPLLIPGSRLALDYPGRLQDFVNILFPSEIVQPGFIPSSIVSDRLIAWAKDEGRLTKIQLDNGEMLIQRLTVGLVLSNNHAPLSDQARKAISVFVRQIRSIKRLTSSPTLERRLLLLDALSSEFHLPEVRLSPSTIRLKLDWLESLPSYTKGAAQSKSSGPINLALDILRQSIGEKSGTVRRLLGAIDGMLDMADWRRGLRLSSDLAHDGPERLLQLLRGPDPEFRDPCRFALLDAFSDYESLKELGAIFSSAIELNLEDLNPNNFAVALTAAPEHALESYVELADRAWGLGKLMEQAKSARPLNAKLGMVTDAYLRWDGAVRATLLDAFTQS